MPTITANPVRGKAGDLIPITFAYAYNNTPIPLDTANYTIKIGVKNNYSDTTYILQKSFTPVYSNVNINGLPFTFDPHLGKAYYILQRADTANIPPGTYLMDTALVDPSGNPVHTDSMFFILSSGIA